MKIPAPSSLIPVVAVVLAGMSTGALAYVGPGAGITAIGSVLALLGGILLAIVGFIWYPLKRLLRRSGKKSGDSGKPGNTSGDTDQQNQP